MRSFEYQLPLLQSTSLSFHTQSGFPSITDYILIFKLH